MRRRIWSAASLLASAVLYNDWLLQLFVPTGLAQADSYVSEAFAADQPYRTLFAGVELACAALITAAGMLGMTSSHRAGTALRTGWTAVTAIGLFSIADVLLPMRCAPSRESGCPPDNVWHTTTSALVHLALFVSMALFTWVGRSRVGGWELVGRWGPWLLPVSMTAAVSSVGPYFGHSGGQGIAQRIHLVTVGCWFALLAVQLVRAKDGPAGTSAPTEVSPKTQTLT